MPWQNGVSLNNLNLLLLMLRVFFKNWTVIYKTTLKKQETNAANPLFIENSWYKWTVKESMEGGGHEVCMEEAGSEGVELNCN